MFLHKHTHIHYYHMENKSKAINIDDSGGIRDIKIVKLH